MKIDGSMGAWAIRRASLCSGSHSATHAYGTMILPRTMLNTAVADILGGGLSCVSFQREFARQTGAGERTTCAPSYQLYECGVFSGT